MSDTERLALIARAGKHLQSFAGATPAPPLPAARIGAAEPEEELDQHRQRQAHDMAAHSHLPRPNADAIAAAAAPEPVAVRLNFAQLRHRGMLTPDNLNSNLGLEYREIKRRLLSNLRSPRAPNGNHNLVMVTSARAAEGKTFTCVNLAISLATERHLRVLLIDADIPRSELGLLFEPCGAVGITDVMRGGDCRIEAVTHRCVDLPNLHVIFSGTRDEHSAEVLATARMAEFWADVSHRYRDGIVLIDTAPVPASVEAANLAAFMHQILFVVASGQTRRPQVQAALESVAACPNISVVLNRAPAWNKPESDGYYHYGAYRARAEGDDNRDFATGRSQDVH